MKNSVESDQRSWKKWYIILVVALTVEIILFFLLGNHFS